MNRTLLLLGGFGLGAGIMYVLDPDRGKRRRALMRAQMQAYRRWTDDLFPSRHSLRRTTRSLSQPGRRLGQQSRHILARTRVPLMSERVRRELRPPHAGQMDLSQGLVMLGWLGLGLGLMYVFDPSTGKRRRALARDKAQLYWYSTGDAIRKKARDTQNRARGTIAGVRQRFIGTDVPSDAVLAARVRAQIGHVVSHAGAIGVNASQGCVSLSGPIPANEVEKLLSTVASVPGVTEVVNQLEVHTDTTHISGLQNGDTTR